MLRTKLKVYAEIMELFKIVFVVIQSKLDYVFVLVSYLDIIMYNNNIFKKNCKIFIKTREYVLLHFIIYFIIFI